MAKGDHIKIRRYAMKFRKPMRFRTLGYWHHGIDCGDGSVIHYVVGRSMQRASIQRTTMSQFLGGRKARIINYYKCYSPDEVVKRAESYLGRRGYNLIFNNCEHFARWCKIGQRSSKQVDTIAHAVGTVVAVAAVGASVGLAPAAAVGVAGYSLVNGKSVIKGMKKVGHNIHKFRKMIR